MFGVGDLLSLFIIIFYVIFMVIVVIVFNGKLLLRFFNYVIFVWVGVVELF